MTMKFLTPEQLRARDAALLEILKEERVENEDGQAWTQFLVQGRDRLDFGSIGILQLQRMLNKAHRAGFEAAKRRSK